MNNNKIIGFELIKEYPGSKGIGYFEKFTTGEFLKYPHLWRPIYKQGYESVGKLTAFKEHAIAFAQFHYNIATKTEGTNVDMEKTYEDFKKQNDIEKLLKRSSELRQELIKDKKGVIMPSNIKLYNSSNEPCDMLIGPCSCGAWHKVEDLKERIDKQEQNKKTN